MRPGMTSRMRDKRRFKCRTLLFFVFTGFLMNLVVTYACWIRVGFIEFDYMSKYWQVEAVDVFGYRQNGYRLGVHGWANSDIFTDPSHTLFNRKDVQMENIFEHDTTIVRTEDIGNSFGWPLLCVSEKTVSQNTRFIPAGSNLLSLTSIKGVTIDLTPKPKWYFSGLQTGINSWHFYSIPIAVKPFGLVLNTGIYATLLYLGRRLWILIRNKRRQSRNLCLSCGYAIENLETCPECGTDHAVSIEKLET